jgi:transcriptional regulator with XRE-family HTH domain
MPKVMALRPIDRNRLRAAREARGLSRERLAAAAGISTRTIARAELGEAQPVRVVVVALAMALGVEVESLTHDDLATPAVAQDPQ